ncbi:MAG: magnesium transporter, partial [Pseudomonadota bacterium]
LMPIVASMGGNAATQTMTVSVRALAVNELTAANRLRMIGKELAVGVFNGMLFAACAAFGTWVWFNTFELPIIIAIAMFINLTIAALAGIIVPLLLSRFKIDPAVASTVVVTTITDCIGFFAFLGIATFILF